MIGLTFQSGGLGFCPGAKLVICSCFIHQPKIAGKKAAAPIGRVAVVPSIVGLGIAGIERCASLCYGLRQLIGGKFKSKGRKPFQTNLQNLVIDQGVLIKPNVVNPTDKCLFDRRTVSAVTDIGDRLQVVQT